MSVVSFSTNRFSAADRLRAWRDFIHSSLFSASIHEFHPLGIEAHSSVRQLGELNAMVFSSNEHSVERTPTDISAERTGAVYISILTRGSAMLYQPGTALVAHPGDVLIYTPDTPYILAFQPATAQVFGELPIGFFREEFALEHHQLLTARKVSLPVQNDRAFSVQELRRLGSDIADSTARSNTIHHRMRRVLDSAVSRAFPGEQDVQYAQAIRVIEGRYQDENLTPEEVAREVQLSIRHLNRKFFERGSSVSRTIDRYRVDYARSLMVSGEWRLPDVAAMSGFGSVSTLRRALTRHTRDAVPGEFRKTLEPRLAGQS